MINDPVPPMLDLAEGRRDERRRFLKLAGASTAVAGGLALLSACGGGGSSPTPSPSPSPTPTPTPTNVATDADFVNFALNLEYLEAQFYSIAVFGRALPESSLTGTVGTRGNVTGGRQVTFTDRATAAFVREIAADKIAHVDLLRSVVTTSTTAAIAQPAINIDGGTDGAFTNLMRQAGVIGASATFDPYASSDNFLLAAFALEDVGVTAYKGLSPLIAAVATLETAAGVLGSHAYHAATIRLALYMRGVDALRTNALQISDARDLLDGTPSTGQGASKDLDQGITVSATDASPNIVPADGNGIAFSRLPGQVLNVLYLRRDAGTSGGFFPAGINNRLDTLRSSAAST